MTLETSADPVQAAFPPVRPAGLADSVYQAILTGIANGSYAANSRLPSENGLAQRFEVSRPVVRAALDRLRRERHIISRQGSGSFVRPKDTAPALGFAPVDSIADIQRCYEYRLTVEPEAAAHAARRRNEAVIARIAAIFETLAIATRQGQHRDDVDFAFHLAIAEASNNHYYAASIQALQAHIAVGMHIHGLSLLGPKSGLAAVLEEHRRILAAIVDGEAARAHDEMRDHVTASRERLFEGRLLDLSI